MIRQLRDNDAEAYVNLRREALLESPLAFASSPADDFASSPDAVREQLRRAAEPVIIGAFREYLVGAVGLYRDRHMKSAHKAHLWGMYVVPIHRGQGIASELLDAALRHARALPGVSFVHLSVSALPRRVRSGSTNARASVSGARSPTLCVTTANRLSNTTWLSSSEVACSKTGFKLRLPPDRGHVSLAVFLPLRFVARGARTPLELLQSRSTGLVALRSTDLNIHSERLLKPVDWLASRPALSCLVFAAFALLLVLTKVAHRGVSVPEIHDEFSYLLAADTFAQGHITNPPHPMAVHFETMHVNFIPTYHSKYPPAQGLMLAIGQLLGHPIIGAWISTALLGGLLCWMLRGWLSPRWAMAGTLLAINQLAAGYWAHSYLGGAVAACGGALLFGALPRVMRRPNLRDSLLMGLGIIVLANSRPYEGALAALPAAIVLLRWLTKQRGTELSFALSRVVLPLCFALVLLVAIVGYYNQRVTGNAALMPWSLHYQQYVVVPVFVWQKPKPKNEWPVYRHDISPRYARPAKPWARCWRALLSRARWQRRCIELPCT